MLHVLEPINWTGNIIRNGNKKSKREVLGYMMEYEQIYLAIEKEVMELSYSITISENQKSVYSPRIADLVLRSGSLLESVLKYKFKMTSEDKVKYDDDRLIESLGLEDSIAFIHWSHYKIDKNTFFPFMKNEERVNKVFSNVSNKGDRQYSWNNAYQSLRHELIASIPYYGNLYYLFEIMAALFVVLEVFSDIFCVAEYDGNGDLVVYTPTSDQRFYNKGKLVKRSK